MAVSSRARLGRPGLLAAVCLVVICARAPALLLHPRFWAEEAVVYFKWAYERHWLEALLTPHNGYLSLFNNAVALVAANLVPLEAAPLVTTLAALLAQMTPITLILFGTVSLFPDPARRAVAAAIVLVTPPSEEIWLNTANSQFFLALAACLLLLENSDLQSRAGRICRRVLLAVAGLTGPVSSFLVPAFAYRAWASRRREAAVHASILTLCAVVQVVFLLSLGERSTAGERFGRLDLPTLGTIVTTRTVMEPLAGSAMAASVSEAIARDGEGSTGGGWRLHLALSAGLVAFLALLLWRARDRGAALLAASFLLIVTLSIIGSLTGDKSSLILVSSFNGGRYFYVPGVLICLLVLSAIDGRPDPALRMRSSVCAGLLLFSLVTNATQFRRHAFVDEKWPDWRAEVAAWRRMPSHELRVWPPPWSLRLDPARRRR